MENGNIDYEDIRLIDTKTLKKMLSCCHNTAVKIGLAAGARVQIGSMVRWKVSNINRYLDSLSGSGTKA